MRPNVVCLLFKKKFKNGEELFLSVSRKSNHSDFGLPGGKVDQGETCEQAIIRECIEETGYMPHGIKRIFFRKNSTDDILTFTCEGLIKVKDVAEEEGVVAWLTKEALLSGSSYRDYNEELINFWESRDE